jgi:hypothetical protein
MLFANNFQINFTLITKCLQSEVSISQQISSYSQAIEPHNYSTRLKNNSVLLLTSILKIIKIYTICTAK